MFEFAILHRVLGTAFVLNLVTITQIFADNCSIPLLSIEISNHTLQDGVALNRGILIDIGGEQVSLRLSTEFNNSRIRNERDCQINANLSAISDCVGASGSTYNLLRSPTWQNAPAGT